MLIPDLAFTLRCFVVSIPLVACSANDSPRAEPAHPDGGREGSSDSGGAASGGSSGSGGASSGGAIASGGGRFAAGGATGTGGSSAGGGLVDGGAGGDGVVDGATLDGAGLTTKYPICAQSCARGKALCPETELAACYARCDGGIDEFPTCVETALALTTCLARQADSDYVCAGGTFRVRYGPCQAERDADAECWTNRP